MSVNDEALRPREPSDERDAAWTGSLEPTTSSDAAATPTAAPSGPVPSGTEPGAAHPPPVSVPDADAAADVSRPLEQPLAPEFQAPAPASTPLGTATAHGAVPGIAYASFVIGIVVASLGVVIALLMILSGFASAATGARLPAQLGFVLAIVGLVPLILVIVFGHIGIRASNEAGASTRFARTGSRLGYLSLLALPGGILIGAFGAGIVAAIT